MLQVDATEARISHFIPSVKLEGSRAEKLETLDTLISYLLKLRQRLSGDAGVASHHEIPSRCLAAPAWPWFFTGALVGAMFLLLTLGARSCA